jgi:hypothetical protein
MNWKETEIVKTSLAMVRFIIGPVAFEYLQTQQGLSDWMN